MLNLRRAPAKREILERIAAHPGCNKAFAIGRVRYSDTRAARSRMIDDMIDMGVIENVSCTYNRFELYLGVSLDVLMGES